MLMEFYILNFNEFHKILIEFCKITNFMNLKNRRNKYQVKMKIWKKKNYNLQSQINEYQENKNWVNLKIKSFSL